MSHIRQQIRSAIVTTLTGLGLTATRVHATRSHPLATTDLPALCVYTVDEGSGLDGTSFGLRRTLSVQVDAVLSATSGIDDAADAVAVEVETALAANRTLGGLAYDCVLAGTRLSFNGEGESRLAIMTFTYEVITRTHITDPSTFY